MAWDDARLADPPQGLFPGGELREMAETVRRIQELGRRIYQAQNDALIGGPGTNAGAVLVSDAEAGPRVHIRCRAGYLAANPPRLRADGRGYRRRQQARRRRRRR